MKRILFNATHQEELRVAIVDRNKLIDFDIHVEGKEQRKQNIYKAKITRIEPSLEACFVDYGYDRQGFLPFKQIHRAYFKSGVDYRTAKINEVLEIGQDLLIQVEKEERGAKGASLTTFISLAGRFLVLMPNNPRAGGVSRRIDGEERQELRQAMNDLSIPSSMGAIARTAAIGRSTEELNWDLTYLLKLWDAIQTAEKQNPSPVFIYQEENIVFRTIRDHFSDKIQEIIVDTDEIYEQVKSFLEEMMPDKLPLLKRYTDDIPLFSRFQIEEQIQSAYGRTVTLPSGGAIVIDHTEALVSIDVNSARATRGSDIEETALKTNLEAAEEVARQMRLRDLGGLIVVDFIDMEDGKHQRMVEHALKEAVSPDRARIQLGKISRFGLMELSRQRLRPALAEGTHTPCQHCNGTGSVRDNESTALSILRILQQESLKEEVEMIHVQVPVEIATFLINEKREDIVNIEQRRNVSIIILPNPHYMASQYKLESIKEAPEHGEKSSGLVDKPQTDLSYQKMKKEQKAQKQEKKVPVVRSVSRSTPPPKKKVPSIFTRLCLALSSLLPKKQKVQKKPVQSKKPLNKKPVRKRPVHTTSTKKGLKPVTQKQDTVLDETETKSTQKRRTSQKRTPKIQKVNIKEKIQKQTKTETTTNESKEPPQIDKKPTQKAEKPSAPKVEVTTTEPKLDSFLTDHQIKPKDEEQKKPRRERERRKPRRTSDEPPAFIPNEEILAQQEKERLEAELKAQKQEIEVNNATKQINDAIKETSSEKVSEESSQKVNTSVSQSSKTTEPHSKKVSSNKTHQDTRLEKKGTELITPYPIKIDGVAPKPLSEELTTAFLKEKDTSIIPEILRNPYESDTTPIKVSLKPVSNPIIEQPKKQVIQLNQPTVSETPTEENVHQETHQETPHQVDEKEISTPLENSSALETTKDEDINTHKEIATESVHLPEAITCDDGSILQLVQTRPEYKKEYKAPQIKLGRKSPTRVNHETSNETLIQVETRPRG